MRAKVVTTLGPGGWQKYGRRFVESFATYWPANVALEIWHHDLDGVVPEIDVPHISFKTLDETSSFQKLRGALGSQAKDGPSLGYCFKAIALSHAAEQDLDWIAFVDADTETMRPVDTFLLESLFDDSVDLTYLYRKSVAESEGSFFAFNLRSPQGASLLTDFWGLYDSLEAFQYKKSHDNAVLDRLVTLHMAHGLKIKNLAEGALGLDAFHQSALGAYMVHYKGPNKDTIADPAMAQPSRYAMVCEIMVQAVRLTGRTTVVEVGTWNGTRAIHMAEAARQAGLTKLCYLGYDTFESGNDRQHEGHTKPHATHDIVAHRLHNYAMVAKRLGFDFTFDLIPGNTLQTLAVAPPYVNEAAFAYIDGGHSYETTKSDYEHLKEIPYIVFDDLILKAEEGAPEGPRRVMNELQPPTQKQAFNSNDGYAGLTQTISLGIVTAPGFSPPQIRTQLQVKPVDSVDKGEQLEHIACNAATITKWPSPCQAHGGIALLVSAGPTLEQFLPDIRAKQAAGATVFAVKHAFPILKKAGISPDYTVILDPRPVTGVSTHGIVRTDLFVDVGPEDKFLLATMTHPSVREELESKGGQIFGWHAYTQGTAEKTPPAFKTGLVVGGGTCAATRMPMLAFIFGFRRFEFFGFDFFYPADTDPAKVKQKLMKIQLGNDQREFLTTGELIAAMQDLGNWNKWMVENQLTVTFHGDGAGAIIWQQTVPNYKVPAEWPT